MADHTPSAANIHPSAQVGGPPQWRNRTSEHPVNVHPSATVGPLSQIDAGAERPTVVGENTHVQGMVHLGHGVQVGKGCDIASGTVVAGEATIGDFVRVGVNATISPYIKIGWGSRVGAGAVVIADVAEGMVVAGNPARVLRPLNGTELAWVQARSSECE